MANSVIGALRVMLGMDTGQFEEGVNRTARESKRLHSELQKTAQNLQKVGRTLATALTAPLLAIGAAGAAAANQLAQDSERMRLAAQNAGSGFEEFQRAAHAAYAGAGIDSQKFADILRDTQDKIGDFAATGGGELRDFFENVAAQQGLSVEDFIGKSSIEQLRLFVDTLQKAGVGSEQMTFYLESIADEGSALLPILRDNGMLLDQLGQKAAVIDPQAAAELKAYTYAQKELETSTRKLTIALAKSGLIEAMTQLVERVASFTTNFAQANPALFKFTVIAGGIAAALGPVLMGISSLITIAPALVKAFGMIRIAAVALMTHPAILLFAGVLAGIYYAWQNWDNITAIVQRLYTGVKAWLVDKLGAVFNWLRDKIKAVTGFFFDMYDAVVGNSYVPDMVDGIADQFARLQEVMVDPAQRAAADTAETMRQMAGEVLGLLDRLFPEIARARGQMEDLARLDAAADAGLIDDDLRRRARLRVLGGGRDRATVSDELLNQGPLEEVGKVKKAVEEMTGVFKDGADKTQVQTVRIADTVQDMAQRISGSLRGLVDGIKRGNFFDIFDGILGIVTSLGGAGVFGKGFQGILQNLPGFAQGGAMQLGGLAGIDRNILSLNGSPIARVSAGETMQIRPANDRGGMGRRLQISVTMDESTGALGAFVRNEAGQIVAQAAPRIASAGARQALGQLRQAQGRTLG